MAKLNLYVSAVLALAALSLDILALTARCSVSPELNVSILVFGLVVQAIAVAFPLVFGGPYSTDLPRRGLAIIGLSLVLFVGGTMAFRYAALFSDAIGEPNYFRSAGLGCRHAT